MQIATFIVGFGAYAWLVFLLQGSSVRKRLPWFALYVWWEFVATFVQLALWVLSRKSYFAVYWWMEAVEVGLIVVALRESFGILFEGLSRKAGFRWLVRGLIGAVIIYSGWQAIYAPPLDSSRFDSFVFGAEFLFRWGIFGMAALAVILSFVFEETIKTREAAVIVGFGISALAFVLFVASYSIVGPKYSFLTKQLPSVGYFLAVGWWIWIFSRPIEKFGFKELGVGPDRMSKEMRQYGQNADEMMRKRW